MKKTLQHIKSIIMICSIIALCAGPANAKECELPEFNIANFNSPSDNPYFPMPGVEGTTYVYEAETEDEFVLNIIYISKDTVPINGVDCTVIYDTEWVYVEELDEWFIEETTEDWHAWDNFGNFWYFGEWTTEFEYNDDWELEDCNHDGSWLAFADGALPGIIIPINPSNGDCYQQEYYEDEAEDQGRVLRTNAKVSIELGDYLECLAMKEWTQLEPGNIEHKYYAQGIGLVFIEELKEKTVFVELVEKYDGAPDYGELPFLVCDE